MTSDLNDAEELLFKIDSLTGELAAAVRLVREAKTSMSTDILEVAVNTLMTEFWDHGFSQTEIRNAFNEAVNDMQRYASGEEVRGN